MMHGEFESLLGEKVTPYFYDHVIEPMYMATTLSKSDFVRLIDGFSLNEIQDRWTINELLKENEALQREVRRLKNPGELQEPEGDEEV